MAIIWRRLSPIKNAKLGLNTYWLKLALVLLLQQSEFSIGNLALLEPNSLVFDWASRLRTILRNSLFVDNWSGNKDASWCRWYRWLDDLSLHCISLTSSIRHAPLENSLLPKPPIHDLSWKVKISFVFHVAVRLMDWDGPSRGMSIRVQVTSCPPRQRYSQILFSPPRCSI